MAETEVAMSDAAAAVLLIGGLLFIFKGLMHATNRCSERVFLSVFVGIGVFLTSVGVVNFF